MSAANFLPDVDFGIHQPMVSAVGETAAVRYHLHTGKSGRRWLVGDQANAADQVWVDGGIGSQGCGGAKVKFRLVDGSEVEFIGPWKTGAAPLFEDAGIDISSRSKVQGVIALDRESRPYPQPYKFSRVLHFDAAPVIRDSRWLEDRAKEHAEALGVRVFYSQVSQGGGIASSVEPKTKLVKS